MILVSHWSIEKINITEGELRYCHPVYCYHCSVFSDVEDITEVLEVTVFDENRRTKHDFLGKVRNLITTEPAAALTKPTLSI